MELFNNTKIEVIIYLIIYILSIAIFYVAGKSRHRWNIYSVLGIIFISLIAGLRAKTVGTDTGTYYVMIDLIRKSDESLIEYMSSNIEILYWLLSKIALFIDQRWLVLAVYQAITIGCVYSVAYTYRKQASLWLVMWLYFCLIFPYSLNIIRQIAAVAYVLAISNYLVIHRPKKFLIASIFSLIFHTTAILGCGLIWLIYTLTMQTKVSRTTLVLGVSIVMVGIYILFLKLIPLVLSVMALVKSSGYEDGGYGDQVGLTSYVSVTDLVFRLSILLIVWLIPVSSLVKKKLIFGYILLIAAEIFLIFLGKMTDLIFRIALYLTVFHLILLPGLITHSRLTKESQILANGLIAILGFSYWWWVFVHNGTNAIIPYSMI